MFRTAVCTFRTAERIFPTAERIFPTAERTFPTAEYRLKAVSLYNYISLSDIIMMPIVI